MNRPQHLLLSRLPLSCCRAALAVACAAGLCAAALAQAAPPTTTTPAAMTQATEPQAKPSTEQRIVRIRVEDEGSRIDEVRYGGQTQSVTVSSKGRLPDYELLPADGARSRANSGAPSSANGAANGRDTAGGQRVWNMLRF
jgi:hypothetical protein